MPGLLMTGLLTGRFATTGNLVCAAICLAMVPAAAQAQQSGSTTPAGEAPVTRGVIILKAEPAPAPKPAPAIAPVRCERPLGNADIGTRRFGNDSARFDRELSRKLKAARQTVSLDISEPWPADGDPPLLVGPWLEELKTSGGKISVAEYCQKSRGLFSFFSRLLKRPPVDRLGAIKRYDAVLQINGADQMVTQILFRRRAPS